MQRKKFGTKQIIGLIVIGAIIATVAPIEIRKITKASGKIKGTELTQEEFITKFSEQLKKVSFFDEEGKSPNFRVTSETEVNEVFTMNYHKPGLFTPKKIKTKKVDFEQKTYDFNNGITNTIERSKERTSTWLKSDKGISRSVENSIVHSQVSKVDGVDKLVNINEIDRTYTAETLLDPELHSLGLYLESALVFATAFSFELYLGMDSISEFKFYQNGNRFYIQNNSFDVSYVYNYETYNTNSKFLIAYNLKENKPSVDISYDYFHAPISMSTLKTKEFGDIHTNGVNYDNTSATHIKFKKINKSLKNRDLGKYDLDNEE